MTEPRVPTDEAGLTRRESLQRVLSSALALGIWPVLGAASQARRSDPGERPDAGLRVLSSAEAATYAAWCDRLAPGAAQAGASSYLDAQLAAPPGDALLFLRVLANPPFVDFYRLGIDGIEAETRARFGAGSRFAGLAAERQRDIIDAAAADTTRAWTDPAPSFFYLVTRADAVDVAYGTEAGFRRLQVPYLAHIRPTSPW